MVIDNHLIFKGEDGNYSMAHIKNAVTDKGTDVAGLNDLLRECFGNEVKELQEKGMEFTQKELIGLVVLEIRRLKGNLCTARAGLRRMSKERERELQQKLKF